MSNEKEDQEEVKGWTYYFAPSNMTKIVSNRKAIFGTWSLVTYIGQFLLIVMCINDYSDGERHIPCGGYPSDGKQPTDVFDKALMLLSIYHLIEWVRVIVFAVCVVIGANLMLIWYVTLPNAIFGLVCYIIAHMVRLSSEGKDCALYQIGRGKFLLGDLIVFYVTFIFQQFPQIFFLMLGKKRLEETLKEADSDEGDDD